MNYLKNSEYSNKRIELFLQSKPLMYGLILMAFLIKIILLPLRPVNGDFDFFVNVWIEFIKNNGYSDALKYDFYNYSPAYIYFLVIIAKLGFNNFFSVKILSILFEYITAYFIGRFLYERTGKSYMKLLSFAVYPLLPTVLINSSYWGQCDSIYTSFIIGSLFFLSQKRNLLSLCFLGIAFSFKLQTFIVVPFYFLLLVKNQIKWYYFLLIPGVYFLSVMPVWILGRPLSNLLLIYFEQSGHYEFLTMNFPNIYVWFDNDYYYLIKNIGLLFTSVICLFAVFILKNKRLSLNLMVKLVFLCSILIPFILPGMHERYMFLGDTLAVVYFLLFLKKFYIPLGVVLMSFISYFFCSKYADYISPHLLSIFYLFIIVCLFKDFYVEMKSENKIV